MRRQALLTASVITLLTSLAWPALAGATPTAAPVPGLPGGYKNLVVIYQENHSFDSVMGLWGPVGGQPVDGVQNGVVPQVDTSGRPYECLPQFNVNLTSPPLPATCTDSVSGVTSHFTNTWFNINTYIPVDAKTCPAGARSPRNGLLIGQGLPGGCISSWEHRFYHNIYQINGGKQDRFVAGSEGLGGSMGVIEPTTMPLWNYLHSAGAPNYVIADRFFQAAFGGSYLNHQFLVAGRAPIDGSFGAMGSGHSGIPAGGLADADPATIKEGILTVPCADPTANDYERACGFFVANTAYGPSNPTRADNVTIPLVDSATYPTIGDTLTSAGVSWNWYSGGWNDAVAGRPGENFTANHQPLNYFTNYAEGGPGRAHLKDVVDFHAAVAAGTLPQVSFVQPYGADNEHPGYASQARGSQFVTDIIKAVTSGPQAQDTLILLAYDEYGGFADHVPVPTVDAWGPGPRIPALLVSARMTKSGVDSTQYDTTSILATLNKAYGLPPLGSRDAIVNPLDNAILAGGVPPAPAPAPPAPEPVPAALTPTLAATGSQALPGIEAGVLLITLGVVVVLTARRRARTH